MFTNTDQSYVQKDFDVIVIGGGAAGCATTYNLARSGANVALLEKFDLNTQASGRNAGSLHGQIQFEPFHELGMTWARNFLPGLSFLVDSLVMWRNLSEELGADLEVGGKGGLMVAQSASDMKALEAKVKLENEIGIDSQLINQAELLEKAPYISKSMLGAAFSPIEGKANPLMTAPAFAAKAREYGATIATGIEVFEIVKEQNFYIIKTSQGDFRAQKIVLTANAGLPQLTEKLGLTLPISDVPVQVSVTEQVEKFVHHLVYFTTEKLTFKQANSGSLLIGGGWPARYNEKGQAVLNVDSLQSNLRVALKVVPTISHIKVIRTWIGVGNGTPDHNPIIGEMRTAPGVYIGMYPYMGFTASPLLGKILSELVLTGKTDYNITPFAADRF